MNVTRTFGRLAGVAALLVATGAAHSMTAQVNDSTEMKDPAASAAVTVDTKTDVVLSDSAVIAMLQVANTQQVAAADLAISNSNSEEVREFARTLKSDHQAVLDQLDAIASQLAGNSLPDSGMAAGMPSDSAQPMTKDDEHRDITHPVTPANADASTGVMSSLEALKGHEFDHGFVRLEINEHKKEIEHLQNDVLPRIENPELKQAIEASIPKLQDHLQKAVELEKMLGKTSG